MCLDRFKTFSHELGERTLDPKNFNHYRRAALITIPLVLLLVILYACTGCEIDGLAYGKWFSYLISIPGFFGHLLSSTTYAGTALDLRNNPDRQPAFWCTFIGIVLGLVVGIALSLMLPGTASFFTILTSMIFTMRCISSYAGLLNRMCTAFLVPCIYLVKELWYWVAQGLNYLCNASLQPERPIWRHERHWSEILLLLIALGVGITCGTVLFATHTAKMIALLGVFTFFTPGLTALLAFAPVICGFIFISMFTSALMSGTDYFSKGITCCKDMILQKSFAPGREKFHEYRGSLLGGVASLAVGITLVLAHLAVLSWATISIITIIMVGATSFSVIAGIFSRLGLTFDGLFKPEDSFAKKSCIVIATLTGFMGLLAIKHGIERLFFPEKNIEDSRSFNPSIPEESKLIIEPVPPAIKSTPSPKNQKKSPATDKPASSGIIPLDLSLIEKENKATYQSTASMMTLSTSSNAKTPPSPKTSSSNSKTPPSPKTSSSDSSTSPLPGSSPPVSPKSSTSSDQRSAKVLSKLHLVPSSNKSKPRLPVENTVSYQQSSCIFL